MTCLREEPPTIITRFFKKPKPLTVEVTPTSVVTGKTKHYPKFSLENDELNNFVSYLQSPDGGERSTAVSKEL